VSPNLKRLALVEWVESGVVNPRSARCSRTSPTMGMRLRAANRVPAGGRFPVNVYQMSGMCWHTSPTAAMAAVQGRGGILEIDYAVFGPAQYSDAVCIFWNLK